ncbi:leucine-rich repeat flightless-interacting protein 2-like isoform X10 [Lethenteron reissneri]|uniref:leucine-rich repeat flightless-interacting protein 2-like isoform X10 n=1 Tax=Lethenteron reissneri TaxID=7753 RepID=UPI002AB611F4|nr:leucine-rich repeat flightless-interacting protein 2-like isoform X10 [Lethenteron reissneri]
MGTPGRKRNPVRETFAAEDDALSHIAKEAEAKLASKRAARAEAREIRLRELERQQKDIYNIQKKYQLPRHNEEYDNIHQWMDGVEVPSTRLSRPQSRQRASPFSDADGLSERSGRSGSRREDYECERDASSGRSRVKNGATKKYPLDHEERYSSRYHRVKPDDEELYSSQLGKYKPRLSSAERESESSDHRRRAPPADDETDEIWQSDKYRRKLGSRKNSYDNWDAGSSRAKAHVVQDDGVRGGYDDMPFSRRTGKRTSSLYSEPLAPARSCRTLGSEDILGSARGWRGSSSRVAAEGVSGSRLSSLVNSRRASPAYTDDHSDNDLAENTGRPLASRSAVSALSSSNLSSKQGNGDIGSLGDVDVSTKDIYELKDQLRDVDSRYTKGLKEIKESLSEVQEKFKKAMVTNAQLDNEKFNLIYQVDTLRDSMEEMEEQMAELRRQHEDKCKDLERQKHAQSVLQYKYDELQEGLKQRDALIEEIKTLQRKEESYVREVNDLQEAIGWKEKKIGALERQKVHFECIMNERDELRQQVTQLKEELKKKHGLVMVPEGEVNGEVGPDGEPLAGGGAVTLVSRQAAQLLEGAGDGPLDIRLKRLVEDKESLVEQVKSLKIQLEETKQKSGKSDSDPTENGMDGIETQRDVTRQLSEHKFKLSKAEQDITALEQSIARLEGQVARYKTASENAEKVEDELKAEKRKLQRELRSAQDRVEELEITNSQLTKRLEKIKSTRNVVLPQE